ncbi:MAG: TIM barrel protein [Planctomycetes bacterium]|nr:TIM barrel protein [Planctomycetota bacterium]
MPLTRRTFLQSTTATLAALALPGCGATARKECEACADDVLGWKISLAQWSLHRTFFGRDGYEKKDPLDFAAIAKGQFGISALEYVNQFYAEKKNDDAYLKDLKKRADDQGVKSVLIMCDREGNLGDADDAKRTQAVENHVRWLEWAKTLGCHSIRVNAASAGTWDEQVKLAADGLRKLSEKATTFGLNVIVENHGGLSSNGKWLAQVMTTVGLKNCGTLPDFGNFRTKKDPDEWYDRYQGVTELMPFAKGVSAKSHEFNEAGDEVRTDYRKMLKIVKAAGYKGHIGVEYEGSQLKEADGIIATKKLLENIFAEMRAAKA